MRLLYTIIKKPFFGNYRVTWRNPLTDEQRKEWKAISFQSGSGASLSGLIAESALPNAKGTIVLGHPMGKEAKGYFLKNGYTEVLRENGYHVFLFDLNGFGESEVGNFDYYEDIIAAGNTAKEQFPKLPVGYMGISMGGQFATIAFAEKHPFEFAIVESAANTLEDFWIHYPIAFKALRLLYFFLPKYRKRIRMIDRIKDAKGLKGLLLIYLDKDEVIRDDAGQKFKEASPLPAQLTVFENAQHAQLPKSPNREAYFRSITTFFDTHTYKQKK